MKEWFTIPELADAKLPDMPHTVSGMRRLADKQGWDLFDDRWRKASKLGGGREYHIRLLPNLARQRLVFVTTAPPEEADQKTRSKLLWTRFNEHLTDAQRAVCQFRLKVLLDVEALSASCLSNAEVLARVRRLHNVSKTSIYEWRGMVAGLNRGDWLPALADGRLVKASGIVRDTADCHPEAWEALCSDYLRAGEPGFSGCYRRMKELAKKMNWSPIPSERTLRRRMDAEHHKAAQVMAREGREAARRLLPTQRRDKTALHAMQAVNTDGHLLDLRIQAPWSEKPVRITLLGIQDVYSGKILSWRLCEAETWEGVRAVIGDMVESFGVPDVFFMDNGKAFASKQISGQVKYRNRYKKLEDELAGVLVSLGADPRFTKPYRGQSKPIERAWKDLAAEVSLHPSMDGAYTGSNVLAKPHNYGSRTVPLEEVNALVADRVAEHNARIGRNSRTAAGRSFDQAFARSYEANAQLIRMPTAEQRSLWLMAADQRTARKPNGLIEYQGNRYWAQPLQSFIGQKVTFRFHPDNLHDAIKIYDLEGRFVCDAPCIADSGFLSVADARFWAKSEAEYLASVRAFLKARSLIAPRDLGRAMLATTQPAADPPRSIVRRMATSSAARKVEVEEVRDEMSQDEFNQRLGANMERLPTNVVSFRAGGGKR